MAIRIRFYTGPLLVAAIMASAACSSSESTGAGIGYDLPPGDLGLAYSIVPHGKPQTELVEMPEAKLLAFLACTEDALGQPVVANQPPAEGQDLAASDCALEQGLDEYVEIWIPASQSELAQARDRWIAASQNCFREAGVTPIPTIDIPSLGPEPDFAGAIAQDPTLEEPLTECMDLAGEDMPGHDH